jgi:hypothetical protein
MWEWRLGRREGCLDLITALRPVMSLRRQAQIDRLLALGAEYPPQSSQVRAFEAYMVRDVAWLSGVLEGDGTFYVVGRTGHPRIALQTSDEDTARAAKEVAGVGRVGGPYVYPGLRPRWVWAVQSQTTTRELAAQLLPFMGERRSEQIRAFLNQA